MAGSTSFRISDEARRSLTERAQLEGISATSVLERLILEGIRELERPGIVFRGPTTDRRAALAGGPDVWEVVARLRELDGPEEERVETVVAEADVPARLVRLALEYAAEHPEEVRERLDRHAVAVERSRRTAARRSELLA